jgi:hypothetical protein
VTFFLIKIIIYAILAALIEIAQLRDWLGNNKKEKV